MLEVIPDFLVWVPVGRILGKVKDMQSWLIPNIRVRLFRGVGSRLIHHNHNMSSRMMLEHLSEKVNDFGGGNPFFMQSKHQVSASADGRHRGHAAALSGNFPFRRLTAWRPSFSQERCQRDVRLVLKIENRPVFLDRSADFRRLVSQPFPPRLLVNFVVLTLRFLVSQSRFSEPSPNRIPRNMNPVLNLKHLVQPSNGP